MFEKWPTCVGDRGCRKGVMFEFRRLNNGLRLILVPMGGVESFAAEIVVGVGSRDESDDLAGLAHLTEHVVLRGSETYPNQDMIESMGGLKNGWTSKDATSFQVKLPAEKWKLGIDYLMSLVSEPLINGHDIEMEKKIVNEEINRENDVVEELVWKKYYGARYLGQSVGRTTLGSKETLEKISDSDVRKQVQRYGSGNMVVALAGKLPPVDEVMAAVEGWAIKLTQGETLMRELPNFGMGPRLDWSVRPQSAQVQLVAGWEAINMADPRRAVLGVLNRIMSYSLSGRLNKAVREERGLAYVIYSDLDLDIDRGMWAIGAGTSGDNLLEMWEVICSELVRLKREKVDEIELAQAIEKRRVPLLFSVENPWSQMEWYADQAMWRPDQILTHQQVIDQTMAVKADEIVELAREILTADRLCVAVVGDENQELKAALGKNLEGW